jgi:hypothetical protein
MNAPVMYYVGLISNVIFLCLAIFGYSYIYGKTAGKYLFLIYFAIAWLLSGVSYVFLIFGTSADQWYMTLIRIIGYLFFLMTILSLIFELSKAKKLG